jgi:hypothetical protein
LLADGDTGKPCRLFHDAIRDRTLEVREEGGGVVNEIVAVNFGAEPVLIVEGESLVGAKQNRVVVKTVLLGPNDKARVPVGCVQHGRWSPGGGRFESGPTMVEPTLRRGTVHEAGARGHVDQARLWSELSLMQATRGSQSRTHDYHEAVAGHAADAAERARAFEMVPGQIGILALCDGVLLGLEALGHPDNWAALAPRLVPSYVLAADAGIADPRWRPRGERRAPEEWLGAVAAAGMRVMPARGLGVEFALAGPGFAGAGLWHDGRPAHVAVFPD